MSSFRSPFQRDRDRIIHSSAFRRLKHKTQVFVEHEGDYYRTRLTHTIEVAQVARTIAGVLGLNTDLAEAVALAHDLGHTPFGHTGEDALERADGALWRLRPQRAGAADRDAAGTALRRFRRAEPDLGDAGRASPSTTVRSPAQCRRSMRPLPYALAEVNAAVGPGACTPMPAPRRRWRRLPTTWPIPTTTCTTGCGRACSPRTT